MDSSVTDGSGLTGLLFSSAGLIISTIKIGEATATAYTQAAGNIETITTLGTYAAPTTGKIRFKEVDSTNHKGVYEIHVADARLASTTQLIISILGATNLAEQDIEIQIESISVTTNNDKGGYSLSAAGITAVQSGLSTFNSLIDLIDVLKINGTTITGPNDLKANVVNLDQAISTTEANIRGGSKSIEDIDVALNTSTIAELPVGAFPKNPTRAQAAMLSYMKIRNRRDTGDPTKASQLEKIYNDAGIMIAKATLTTSGDDFIKQEFISG